LFRAHIDDWRAVVDCIMIDTNYDGDVFKVSLSDIPAKKTDLVTGSYQLPIKNHQATVAVKIIDMLGEELIITAKP
ncbi:MAG: site-specific DNA-methyltransferase, partial [Methylophaga sp.]|nr:site-specific DNA-methyltransferase [Methylophaga sp.]